VGWLLFVLYNVALIPATLLALLLLPFKAGKDRGYVEHIGERLGMLPRVSKPVVWLHAVSVGECIAAAPLLRELKDKGEDGRFVDLVTATTPTGRRILEGFSGVSVATFPLDLAPCVALAVWRVRPLAIILMESEIWPNFLLAAHLWKIPIVLANGRISDRTLRRGRLARPLFQLCYQWLTRVFAQTEEDARRFRELGAPPSVVEVAGNTKFDQLSQGLAVSSELRELLEGLDIVCGASTHPGEEEKVLEAFHILRKRHPGVRLLLAPRHITRTAQVRQLCEGKGLSVALRSSLIKGVRNGSLESDILLLDTMGELACMFGFCRAAFMGGSWAPVGGHNILEPLRGGCPVCFGAKMSNFRDIAQMTLQKGLARQVNSPEELAQFWSEFVGDASHANQRSFAVEAASFVREHSGASRLVANAVLEILAHGRASSGLKATPLSDRGTVPTSTGAELATKEHLR
jgi:3-deoxy-D-manno-octulosonic-acid transferase